MDQSEASQLRQRIEAYAFDKPGVNYPFSAKLADEQAWPIEFTSRAIAEYRRFVFLAVAAEHPVSPSPIVGSERCLLRTSGPEKNRRSKRHPSRLSTDDGIGSFESRSGWRCR